MRKKCKHCGKQLVGNQKKFCSNICRINGLHIKPWNVGLTKETDARVAKQNNKNGHSWNYGFKKGCDPRWMEFKQRSKRVECVCQGCGKVFIVTEAESKKRKYCQISCRPSWNKNLTKEIDTRIANSAAKNGETQKKLWKDIEYAKRVAIAQGRKPNKKENFLDEFLQENYPNTWKYVGDGYTWIAGRNPDFLHIGGKKQIIEMFGCYWHGCKECYPKIKKENDEQITIEHFKKYGFECLVLWEHELKDVESFSLKIKGFSC